MRKAVPSDKSCYCINLRRAANTLTKYYDKAFAPLNITTSQFSLLNDIRLLKSCNKSELAKYARLDRTTIIRGLNVLFEKKLIQELPGKNNRNKVIQLTKEGEAIVIKGLCKWEEVQEEFALIIGEDSVLSLNQLFTSIEMLEQ